MEKQKLGFYNSLILLRSSETIMQIAKNRECSLTDWFELLDQVDIISQEILILHERFAPQNKKIDKRMFIDKLSKLKNI